MIAITTRSSMSVKPGHDGRELMFPSCGHGERTGNVIQPATAPAVMAVLDRCLALSHL